MFLGLFPCAVTHSLLPPIHSRLKPTRMSNATRPPLSTTPEAHFFMTHTPTATRGTQTPSPSPRSRLLQGWGMTQHPAPLAVGPHLSERRKQWVTASLGWGTGTACVTPSLQSLLCSKLPHRGRLTWLLPPPASRYLWAGNRMDRHTV